MRTLYSMRMRTAGCRLPLALFLTLCLAVVALGHASSRASSGTTVLVSSSAVSASGQTGVTSVSVTLAPQDSLSEFEVHITYDPAILEVEDADAIVMNPRWDPPAGLPLLIDAGVPGVVVVHASTGDPCPVGASCPLFSFAWRALVNGSTSVTVSMQSLTGTESGEGGTLSGVQVTPGNVTVGPASQPSPTAPASATPTSSPVATATSVSTASPTPTSAAAAT
jgi:hypothetical protein